MEVTLTDTTTTAPRVYTIAEFCRLYSISRSQLYRESAAGRLPIRKSGTRSLISREDAESWFASLPVAKRAA